MSYDKLQNQRKKQRAKHLLNWRDDLADIAAGFAMIAAGVALVSFVLLWSN